MKVAAYQAPLEATHSLEVVNLLRQQVLSCEANGVEILCYPEAVLGGLADYADDPAKIALGVDQLDRILQPLSNETVTTIVGFTESQNGRLYNSAAVFHKGSVAGVYRKIHPAINRSVYHAGQQIPVFTIGDLMFGIVICYDSTFVEPARTMASKGATVLFVPTNNGMPEGRGGLECVDAARIADVRLAKENNVYVIRADVTGSYRGLGSLGSSEIIDPVGSVLMSSTESRPDLLIAAIE